MIRGTTSGAVTLLYGAPGSNYSSDEIRSYHHDSGYTIFFLAARVIRLRPSWQHSVPAGSHCMEIYYLELITLRR